MTRPLSQEALTALKARHNNGNLNLNFVFVLFLVWCVPQNAIVTTNSNNQSCQEAQLHCLGLNGCRQALSNFFTRCNRVLLGNEFEAGTCPTACKHAMVSLFSAENNAGVAFVKCHCHDNKMCLERKRQLEVCTNEVMNSVTLLHQQTTPLTCNLAIWVCEAETSCLTALRYYYNRCERLFSGNNRCSSKCKNSLRILSRQPRASNLRTCVCDGSEDFDCHKWKVNTEKLCFKSRFNLSDKNALRRLRRRRRRKRMKAWRKLSDKRHGRRSHRKRGRRRRKRNKRNPRKT